MAMIVDGRKIAQIKQTQLCEGVSELSVKPFLVTVLVGDNKASETYVKIKQKTADSVGIRNKIYRIPAGCSQTELMLTVKTLNRNPEVHGILLQLPLPEGIDTQAILAEISPHKDVDGSTFVNAGKLQHGIPGGFVPCTAQACLDILDYHQIDVSGRDVVISDNR